MCPLEVAGVSTSRNPTAPDTIPIIANVERVDGSWRSKQRESATLVTMGVVLLKTMKVSTFEY